MQDVHNKQAHFSYEILDKWEAGLVLAGQEVKAVKNGQLSLKSAYVTVLNDPLPALYLMKAHISPYKYAGRLTAYDPERPRKLLVKKGELKTLIGKLEQTGLTMVPLRVYTKRNLIKVEIGLARGKKMFEKKEAKKLKDVDREIRRTLKYQQ